MKAPHIKQLVIGLPATGKTTFLAAFWQVVDSGEVRGSMKLEEVHGDREYLNRIRNDWLCCRPIGRTKIDATQLVSMKLSGSSNGEVVEVFFPDMSGESFRLQWKERRWTREYDTLVSGADGVLLFVHPERVKEPIRIDIADPLVDELDKEENSISSGQEELAAWDPDLAPTQVQLVELFQFLAVRAADRLPFRVAVIVSAWDLVCNDGKSPEEWIVARLPFLDQYLKANSGLFRTRTYGISAQGGDLERDADSLRDRFRPSERIIVVGQDCEANDLTAPVRWLMSKC